MRLLYALGILALVWANVTAVALGNMRAIGTIAALILIARHWPHRSHPFLARAVGAGPASFITGHKPKTPAPAPPIKHAPATGPQIPVN